MAKKEAEKPQFYEATDKLKSALAEFEAILEEEGPNEEHRQETLRRHEMLREIKKLLESLT